uniref:uncharacterized protein LOC122595406 n=1 Tax=Erigeron canadensis TaxID=72917 RepID=UPI001CB9D089|nr:uncharacterized protein LOC122595406 [Erigeron canadensis]
MSDLRQFEHLKIPLEAIITATNNFSDESLIGRGGFGKVYKGDVVRSEGETVAAIKRLDGRYGQGDPQFWKEIMLLSQYKHTNIVSLLGYCDDCDEKILVYEYAPKKSLDRYLNSSELNWVQRLKICSGVAHGLAYLHEADGTTQQRVLHRDIKSSNIILDDNWNAKIADFGLSKFGPANQEFTFMISQAVGTHGYVDPLYVETGLLTKESDVFSFGVVLFEVLCGRLCFGYQGDRNQPLIGLVRQAYEQNTIREIICNSIRDEIDGYSLDVFTKIAYQCLKRERKERPKMSLIVTRLETALICQEMRATPSTFSFSSTSASPSHPSSSIQVSTLCRQFEFSEIQLATDNFDESLVIGKGGFGTVYKGFINSESTLMVVAIKRRHSMAFQGAEEFGAELELLPTLRHCNIVPLIGYCNDGEEMILVYDYITNGTLYQHLLELGTPLSWIQRLKICIGIARGLHYLHSGVGIEAGVIHRDVKSSNIMLNESWAAKITDFGLALRGPTDDQPLNYAEDLVRGTFGYLDPDYYMTGKLTMKTDVYAFGVVLIEVLCRMSATVRNLGKGLIICFQDCVREGKWKDIPDIDISHQIAPKCLKEFGRIAERCLDVNPRKRPTMAEVLFSLESLLIIQEKYDDSLQPADCDDLQPSTPVKPLSFLDYNDFGRIETTKTNDLVDELKDLITYDGTISNKVTLKQENAYRLDEKIEVFLETGANFLSEKELFCQFSVKNILAIVMLEAIKAATDNFSDECLIGEGGFGKVYKGEIVYFEGKTVAALKRLDRRFGQGDPQFWKEIMMLSQYKHTNIVSLLGYCDDCGEKILVYEYAPRTSLDQYLNSSELTWVRRLKICIGAAQGLAYLHNAAGTTQQRILHRDIKSSNIILDDNWNAKITDFGLSKFGPANQRFTFLFSEAVGTQGYVDPLYAETGFLTKESDVYSFGVVLFEVLCGRLCFGYTDNKNQPLIKLARQSYEQNTIKEIICNNIKDKINRYSLQVFTTITYQCLRREREERPKISLVVTALETALKCQETKPSTFSFSPASPSLPSSSIQGSPLYRQFEFPEIQFATQNFDESLVIGKSSFGKVYKGDVIIGSTLMGVAIKRWDSSSMQGAEEFRTEHELLPMLRHCNIVPLIGYCNYGDEMILVYEYMHNGTLNEHLHKLGTPLSWIQRLKICIGAARGLHYLHSGTGVEVGVIHQDIKSSNIMLHQNWAPKITDFKLAMIGPTNDQPLTYVDTLVTSNYGYLDPDYFLSGKLTMKSDVYAFGVVLLEVLCRMRAIDRRLELQNLAAWFQDCIKKGKWKDIPDFYISHQIAPKCLKEFGRIAERCLYENPKKRPTMAEVLFSLESLLTIQEKYDDSLQSAGRTIFGRIFNSSTEI